MQAFDHGGRHNRNGEPPAVHIPNAIHGEIFASVFGRLLRVINEDLVHSVAVTLEANLVVIGGCGQGGKQARNRLVILHEVVDEALVDGGEHFRLPCFQVSVAGAEVVLHV